MNAEAGNLFAGVPPSAEGERFDDLLTAPGLKIERIVSTGQSSPPGFWYDRGWTEWVLLLSGAAAVEFEGEAEPRQLVPGSYLHIPPGCRHRIAWTSPNEPTLWLAVHAGDLEGLNGAWDPHATAYFVIVRSEATQQSRTSRPNAVRLALRGDTRMIAVRSHRRVRSAPRRPRR